MSDRTAQGLTLRAQRSRRTQRPQTRIVFLVIFVIFVAERVPSAVSAQTPQPGQSAAAETPREAALTILERANRPFVPYVAAAGKRLTVVAELSAASIQAGRWKDGADVDVRAMGPGDEPIATAKARIEPGTFSVAVPLTVRAAWPTRVFIALRGGAERPVEDWVKLEPPSGALVGEAVAYRSGSRIAP